MPSGECKPDAQVDPLSGSGGSAERPTESAVQPTVMAAAGAVVAAPDAPETAAAFFDDLAAAADIAAVSDRERYVPVGELGRGGMGRVDVVFDRLLGRPVAQKKVLEAHNDRYLVSEGQIGAQLEHPAIVPVYDLGADAEGRPFYTMRVVNGRALSQILWDEHGGGQERLGLTKLLGILRQVCPAVDYAHSRGVVHRDLKPDNVVVGAFGEVYVLDWGVACVTDDSDIRQSERMPGSEAVAGTPGYMAPEQALAEPVDGRTDVFALGVILHEILTGELPFDDADLQTAGHLPRRPLGGRRRASWDPVCHVPETPHVRRRLPPGPEPRPRPKLRAHRRAHEALTARRAFRFRRFFAPASALRRYTDLGAAQLSAVAPGRTGRSEVAAELEDAILRALRRITRSIDLHSRQLASTYGLTGPQLVALRAIAKLGPLTPSEVAREISLSQATVTGIVDRLSARQLVTRARSTKDRRLVTVTITPAGLALIDSAPSPLQERFAQRLGTLSAEEQAIIRLTLEKIVRMMDGEDLDAAPILSTSPVGLTGTEIVDEVTTAPTPTDVGLPPPPSGEQGPDEKPD